MKKLFALLLFGILLLGCSQQQPSQPDAGKVAATAQPPEQKTLVEGSTDQGTAKLAVDVMTIVQIQQAGIPAKCLVNTKTDSGETAKTTVYLLGQKIRTETTLSGKNVVALFKDNNPHVLLDEQSKAEVEKSLGKKCDWLLMNFKLPQAKTVAGSAQDPSKITSLPKSDYYCAQDSFGDEKFETLGTVCSLDDLLGQFKMPA